MEILLVGKSSNIINTFPAHSHGHWEILLGLSGQGTATIDGEQHPFEEGTIFCIPPDTLHSKTAENGFLDGCVIVKDFPVLQRQKINVFEDDSNNTFQQLMLLAFEIQMKNEPNAKGIINSLGDAMYQLLVSWSASQCKRNAPVETFMNILLANISNCHFSISDEMNKTGYCNRYFRKMFKDFTGLSPVKYLNHLRIEYSKKQLHQYHSVYTIKEISISSGFTDPYYFSRLFKQHEGVSPQRYRQNLIQ